MTLVRVGAPTPAVASATTTPTTAAFTPNAGSGYLAIVSMQTNQSGQVQSTVAWNSGGTGSTPWTLIGSSYAGQFNGGVEVWHCYFPPGTSPPSSTVSATENANGYAPYGSLLCIEEVTGEGQLAPGGATLTTIPGGALANSITPKFSGSLLYGVGMDRNFSTAVTAATGNTSIGFNTQGGAREWAVVVTGGTTAGTAVTVGVTSTDTNVNAMLSIEIAPVGSQIEIDPAAPAVASTTAAFNTTALSAASYTPPLAGMTVAAIVTGRSANNSTATTTVTDNIGNTYTLLKRQNTASTNNGGFVEIWAFTYTASPGAVVVKSTAANANATAGQLTVLGLLNTSAGASGTTAGKSNGTAAALDIAGTPAKAASIVIGGATRNGSSTAPAATANITTIGATAITTGTPVHHLDSFKLTAPTTVTSTLAGYTTSSVGQVAWAELEYVAPAASAAVPAASLLAM